MEYAHHNANGVLACLDENGWWGGKFICFGSNCANDSATFELEPGPVLVNDALRSDLPASSNAANIAPLGLGLGFGLGIPHLAALVGCLYFWTRLQRQPKPSKPPYQPDAGQGLVHTWTESAAIGPNSGSVPHSAPPTDVITMPHRSTVVPELGDTSTFDSRKVLNKPNDGSVGRLVSQME